MAAYASEQFLHGRGEESSEDIFSFCLPSVCPTYWVTGYPLANPGKLLGDTVRQLEDNSEHMMSECQ